MRFLLIKNQREFCDFYGHAVYKVPIALFNYLIVNIDPRNKLNCFSTLHNIFSFIFEMLKICREGVTLNVDINDPI